MVRLQQWNLNVIKQIEILFLLILRKLIDMMSQTKNGSIFKQKKTKNIVDNLFFGSDQKNVRQYTRNIDSVLFTWLDEINQIIEFNSVEKDSEEYELLKKCIMRCTREILYDIIRFFDNSVDISKLQAIGAVCYVLAYKYMGHYDYEKFRGYKWLSYITHDAYDMKYLISMEIEILKMNDWVLCKKVYNRLKKMFY